MPVCVCSRNKGRLITLIFAWLPPGDLSHPARVSYDFGENFCRAEEAAGRLGRLLYFWEMALGETEAETGRGQSFYS